MMKNVMQMAATAARKAATAKLAMSRKVQTAARAPRQAVMINGLLMAATLARTTDVAKVAMSAKAMKTTGGMRKGIIV